MLRNLQHKMMKSILTSENTIEQYIQQTVGQDNLDRLGVYRNNTFVSLKQALLSVFPVTSEIISVEFFRFVSGEFIKNHPPLKGALLFYGDTFPEFLGAYESCVHYPFLKDLATLEWCLHESENAEDEALLCADTFQNKNLTNVDMFRFVKAKHVHVLYSDYAVASLYKNVRGGTFIEGLDVKNNEVALVYRDENLDGKVYILSDDQAKILERIFQGENIGSVIHFMEEHNISEQVLQQVLTIGLKFGLFVNHTEKRKRDDE